MAMDVLASVPLKDLNWPSTLAAPYLQKILVDGEAIGAVRQAVFGQIIFDMAAGWWPADG